MATLKELFEAIATTRTAYESELASRIKIGDRVRVRQPQGEFIATVTGVNGSQVRIRGENGREHRVEATRLIEHDQL